MDFVMKLMADEKEASEKNIKILAAKKARYLKAINKPELIDFDCSDIDIYSEQKIIQGMNFSALKQNVSSVLFDDSVVINAFKSYKIPEFSLDTYLQCVKAFLLDYKGFVPTNITNMSKIYEYILANARDFDDPKKNMFIFENGDKVLEVPTLEQIDDKQLDDSEYARAIDELKTSYNEEKYRKLNVNVTFLLLVTARGLVKGHAHLKSAFMKMAIQKTHKDMCPQPFNDDLPVISEKCSLFTLNNIHYLHGVFQTLILYAYKTKESLTKRILAVTCMQYFKNTGLQMYATFYEVVHLYGVNESDLWDNLMEKSKVCTGSYNWDIGESLANLADFHHNKYEGEKCGKSYDLFPYCRVLNQRYFANLSAKQNLQLTYTLALLVDLKLGLENSFMRNAAWTKQRNNVFSETMAAKVAASVKAAIDK